MEPRQRSQAPIGFLYLRGPSQVGTIITSVELEKP